MMTQATPTVTKRIASAPRRWWRKFDRMTFEMMNPPVPAHMRAAWKDVPGPVPSNARTPTNRTAESNHIPNTACRGDFMISDSTTDHADTTAFSAAIRAAAPGRSERNDAGETVTRRWRRAIDQFTLDTMNAPIPAHVRAAKNSNDSAKSDFAAGVRANAPGRRS